MRFIGRGPSVETSTVQNADVVVQIGNTKTALKAAQLLGANVRFSRSVDIKSSKPDDPYHSTPEDEDLAMEALMRMKEALEVSPKHPDAGDGPWSPFSPDDYDTQPKFKLSNGDSDTLLRLHREPSDATLPAYYDPAAQPYYVSQQTSASAVRDMALRKGAPTIFDNFGPPPTGDRKSLAPGMVHGESLRHSRSRSQSKLKALDLVHLFPLPKQSNGRGPSPSRHSAMPDRVDLPLPPLPGDRKLRKSKTTGQRPNTSGSGGAGRSRPFDEDILDQHKTHVRRPPKGIQNWFDAYLDDDDEDEDGDVKGDLEEQEPQELPAEDVLPPAYSAPNRQVSRASQKSSIHPRTPHDSHHPPQQAVERALQQAGLNRNSSSSTANSIQSSHLGQSRRRLAAGGKLATSTLGRESVLSLSESEYEDEEEDGEGDDDEDTERGKLPAIRDSILDAREITIANASSVDVLRLQRPTQLTSIRTSSHDESKRSSQRSSASGPSTQKRDKPLPMPPLHQDQAYSAAATADPVSLRRLNGLSLESGFTTGTTETSNTGMTGDTQSSGTSFQDTGNASPLDPAHMMAVTDEEKMLLDLIRQKRVAMQQMSFTEGYQLALRTEQQRLAKRTASAEQRALRALKKKESSEQYREQHRASDLSATSQTPTQETEMKRQLSAIRKEQVDEKFQMERFLGMSQPQPLSSHPPDAPKDMRVRAPSGEVLPATRYSPATYSTPATLSPEVNSGYFSADECETESARMRVKQFISSKGAPPPLNSGMKTMRRHTIRQPSSLPPSPVAEEGQVHSPPPLPLRSPERPLSGNHHERNVSQFTVSTLTHKPSSSSLHDEPRDRSPVSAFSGGFRRQPFESPLQLTHEPVLLPPKPEAPTHAQFVSKSSSTPHLSFSSSSPFGNLISAASRVSVQQSPYRPASLEGMYPTAKSTSTGKQPEVRQPLPRLNTVDSVLEDSTPGARESVLSITSAGEEVLAAWNELGGGREALQVKRRV